ncbi:GntR family transcriptional regulator [Castellaniella caeni]|uniref:GntR family transcriptional regulator n=1 Tax=Castellaniella caeni TaxID=266123 RepID=UPI000C9F04EB|nr:GntR family transcriptional regulator [Castellaniella caeni]
MNREPSRSASVADIVALLEADIIFGRLRPNQELTEDTLMERFEAKRHVVRSVIQELVGRRLVVKPRSRSARVKDFTFEEVGEIYHMRELLQRDAALIMPLPASAQALAALKEAYVKHAAAVSIAADGSLIRRLNDQFHDQLFALSCNRELCKAIAFYTEVSNPIRSYGIVAPEWLQQAVREHAAMIQAIEAQDRVALARLVVDHMQPTRQRWESLHVGRAPQQNDH